MKENLYQAAELTLEIQAANIRKASLYFRAINHPLRQQIVKLLAKEGKLTVTALYVQLHLEQSVCSQHLAILRRAGFVRAERNANLVFYTVNTEQLQQFQFTAEQLLN